MESNAVREYILVILTILLAICIRCQALQKTPIIETESGPVQGYVQQTVYKNLGYSIFKGIPFALPPIGHLRFKPPVPIEPWTDVFDATEEGPTCPQFDTLFEKNTYTGDEDCLHLNVYTPVLDFNSTVKYPVMVWIYGGSFTQGYKNQSLYGPDYFIEEGAIIVIPNYRLGVLGFLNLGLPEAHGNAGLMDQVLALKWVQKNIEKFGGDPNNVTLFGESAGSSSVMLHDLSHQSEGLYQRTIAQSGTPLILLSQSSNAALVSAYWLANLLGFHSTDRKQLLEFYLKADPYDLVMKTTRMYPLSEFTMRPFLPSMEDTRVANQSEIFLSECPITLMMEGKIRDGPKMLGFNKNELYALPEDCHGHYHPCICLSIAQSGSPLILLSQSPAEALNSAYWLAHLLGFHTTDREHLLEFYQNANPYDLVMKTTKMYLFSDLVTRPFQPSIEDTRVANQSEIFLSECPITLMMEGQIRKGPKMIGFNKNELYAFAKDVGIVDLLDLFLPYNVTVEIVSDLAQLLTNIIVAAEIELNQRFYAAHNELHPVYYYILTYTGFPHHTITDFPVKKTAHGDDVGLLFTSLKYGLTNSTDPSDPLNVFRRKMARLWVNFATHSNPTPTFNNPINVTWEPSGSSGRQLDMNWNSKIIPRALGAFGAFVESIYYTLLPLSSSCKKISYATPYTDLFSLDEFNIPLQIGTPLSFPNITSLLNPETITSIIHSIASNSLIKSFSPSSSSGFSNFSSLISFPNLVN